MVTLASAKEYADAQDAATLASAKEYTDTTAASAAAKAVADVVAGAPSDFDTLKEVADWIMSDTTGAAALQTDVAGLKTKVSTLESASHTHANKAELDKIADGDKAKWDAHVANADIHVTAEQKAAWTAKQNALANADVLAAITSTQVTNWDDAASKESGTIAAEISPVSEIERFTSPRVAEPPLRVRAPALPPTELTPAALTAPSQAATFSAVIPSRTVLFACTCAFVAASSQLVT